MFTVNLSNYSIFPITFATAIVAVAVATLEKLQLNGRVALSLKGFVLYIRCGDL